MSEARRSGARRLVGAIRRRLRPAPPTPNATDRAIDRIIGSRLFDRDYYELQADRPFESLESAVRHYVTTGERAGFAPHPLIEPEWLQRGRKKKRAQAFARWLEFDRDSVSPHPRLEAGAALDGRDVDGHGLDGWHRMRALAVDVAKEYASQQRSRLWGAPRSFQPPPGGGTARVSVIVDLERGEMATPLEHLLDVGHEVVVLTSDGAIDIDARATVVVSGATSYGERIAEAVTHATRPYLFVLHPGDRVADGWLESATSDFCFGAIATGDGLAAGEAFDQDGLLWGDHSAISRSAVVSRELFEKVGTHDSAFEFALRASRLVEPRFLPVVALTAVGDPEAGQVERARMLCDWESGRSAPRAADVVSLLIPVYENWNLTIAAVQAALRTSDDTEVVLVDNGSRRSVGAIVRAAFLDEPRVIYRRLPSNTNFATGSNLALLASHGERVVFMNNDTEPQSGWEESLLGALDDGSVRAAQPLLVYPDRTIQSAGTLFHGPFALPTHALVGHPVEDAQYGDVDGLEAVTAAFMACRASEVLAVGGFDPAFANGMEDVDLCLRLADRFGGAYRVVTSSIVVHRESKSPGRFDRVDANRTLFMDRWGTTLPVTDRSVFERGGFAAGEALTVVQFEGYRSVAVALTRPHRIVQSGPAAGVPSLRWAIKQAAHSGSRGDIWGDTHFSADLARALRALGQDVVVDRRSAHERGSAEFDDVILALRGLVPIAPQEHATSVVWVISHPELVTPEELAGFDLAYAASTSWAAEASVSSERHVAAMLQATDPERFHPGAADPELASDVLFVGRTRRVFRPVVRDAIAVGADLTLYGDGWDEFIDSSHVRAHSLDNELLPAAYRSARIVLNDHWEDMAALGFVSNRLFDAAATGARIVTDAVEGLDELFHGLARTYETPDDLARLLSDEATWPDADERAAIAATVARRDSFAARARVLLADVLDARNVEHDLRSRQF